MKNVNTYSYQKIKLPVREKNNFFLKDSLNINLNDKRSGAIPDFINEIRKLFL